MQMMTTVDVETAMIIGIIGIDDGDAEEDERSPESVQIERISISGYM